MAQAPLCQNCGTALAGRWCHACGQDRALALRPFREMLLEWSDAVLGWETRTGRTLRALFLEPGRLTVEFAAGRRAGWIHPLRLYLAANFVALAVFGATSGTIVTRYAANLGESGELAHLGALVLRISAAMVVLLPTVAACYALAFRGLGRYYAEHLVFVLNVSSWVFLVQALASALQYLMALADAPYWWVSGTRGVAHLLVIAYGMMAARRAYGMGWGQTLTRVVIANLLFTPFVMLTFWLALGRGA